MPPEALDELDAKLGPADRFVVATLRDENAQQRKRLDANIEQIRILADQIAISTEQIADLTRRIFGNRSEKLPTVKEELRCRVVPDELTADGTPMPTEPEGARVLPTCATCAAFPSRRQRMPGPSSRTRIRLRIAPSMTRFRREGRRGERRRPRWPVR
ncbi:MAG TPA: hypothetical protein VIV60_12935 [Polyangiaceae bacterium]